MAETKVTRVMALDYALEVVANSFDECQDDYVLEVHNVLTRMREQLLKPKAAAPGKTKARLENEVLANRLYGLAPETPFDGKFVMEHLTGVLTPQKVVGVMRVGIEMGLFERIKEGKRTVYRAL